MSSTSIAPGSPSSLREANSARIVDSVKKFGRITQVELAAATGLSPATVSNIVKQLTANGVVRTSTTIRSGRRAQLVSMATSSSLCVGIHVGPRHLSIEVADESHEVSAGQRLPLPSNHRADTTLDRAALLVMELAENVDSTLSEVNALALVLPLPVDPATGTPSPGGHMADMSDWENLDVAGVLGRRLGAPVLVENDAHAAALGESRFGSLRGVDNAIYVHASHHVGAGLVVDGRLHRGNRGLAGQIGHVQVDPAGIICRCGSRGCLETVVGADALLGLMRMNRSIRSLADIVRGANEGDPGCRQVVADAAAAIGAVVADLAVATAPTHIVLGGELASTGDVFLTPVNEALSRRAFLPTDIALTTTTLEGRAEVLGALALARETETEAGRR
ncbi:ROK family transcriptional regulator [Schaalia sp. 19OD2882]|uniref:ROK family transcriptional regulator n=1 Tax=Schaalia sp. 19OD2882 TaxID=2794089 RepID=UPI001C1F0C79|nr:ROK family transcriptional regulator [Schaalia sp. 19OD2882]QWW19125.1 ROK family transcriptional regulator [Schaalia sp. 19OD2882]